MRKARRRLIDRAHYIKYRSVARSLLESANDLSELAESDDQYGNAIGIIAIHSAIAFSDALCIHFAGFKSVEGDHLHIVDAVKDALGTRTDPQMLKKLHRIVAKKDQVSYQGMYFTVGDAQQLIHDLFEFAAWSDELLK